jgi:hypothetical protein
MQITPRQTATQQDLVQTSRCLCTGQGTQCIHGHNTGPAITAATSGFQHFSEGPAACLSNSNQQRPVCLNWHTQKQPPNKATVPLACYRLGYAEYQRYTFVCDPPARGRDQPNPCCDWQVSLDYARMQTSPVNIFIARMPDRSAKCRPALLMSDCSDCGMYCSSGCQ